MDNATDLEPFGGERISGANSDDSQRRLLRNGTNGPEGISAPFQDSTLHLPSGRASAQQRPDDLGRGHHHQPGDRDGGEEAERSAPGAPAADLPGPRRLRDDEVG